MAGLESCGGKRGHVQGAPHLEAPAHDAPSAPAAARIVGVRGDPHQRADLAAVEPTQLGQLSDQCGGGDATDAGYALQQLGHGGVVLLDMAQHLGIELAGNGFEQRLNARAHEPGLVVKRS